MSKGKSDITDVSSTAVWQSRLIGVHLRKLQVVATAPCCRVLVREERLSRVGRLQRSQRGSVGPPWKVCTFRKCARFMGLEKSASFQRALRLGEERRPFCEECSRRDRARAPTSNLKVELSRRVELAAYYSFREIANAWNILEVIILCPKRRCVSQCCRVDDAVGEGEGMLCRLKSQR